MSDGIFKAIRVLAAAMERRFPASFCGNYGAKIVIYGDGSGYFDDCGIDGKSSFDNAEEATDVLENQ